MASILRHPCKEIYENNNKGAKLKYLPAFCSFGGPSDADSHGPHKIGFGMASIRDETQLCSAGGQSGELFGGRMAHVIDIGGCDETTRQVA